MPIRDFFENFLPWDTRYALIPSQVQQVWRKAQVPFTPRSYTFWRVQPYLDPTYTAPMIDLIRGKLPPRYRYRHFTIAKRDGTRREIAEPGIDLKAMQGRILAHFLTRMPHRAAVGYRKGYSTADHAWAHAGAALIITADVADFFPSTTRYRVRQFWRGVTFMRQPLHDDEVMLLTNLTTYRGALPQGAPTSPALSNLVNAPMDERLYHLTMQSGGTYTRYADDLAFSWRGRTRPPADFEATVRRILREYGYRLHPRKGWNAYQRADEPVITGAQLTRGGGVDVPPEVQHIMDRLARSRDPYDADRLHGYEGYRAMLRDHPRR